jgi:hypothetical protein
MWLSTTGSLGGENGGGSSTLTRSRSDLGPETRVQRVKDGVLDAADVLVIRHQ